MPGYAFVNGAIHSVDPPKAFVNGAIRQCVQGWAQVNGVWRPIWQQIVYPIVSSGWVRTHGSRGSVPGTLWGDTVGYCYFNFTRYQTITAVMIRVSIRKKQGSWHGNGGRWGVGDQVQWTADDHTGEQVSTWMPCSVPPSQQLQIYGRGNSDKGDGKSYNWMEIENLQFS